jgi:hypothetical protein
MKHTALVISAVLVAAPAASWAELVTPQEIRACIRRNVPEVTSLQAVEFSSRDRLGEERTTHVSIASRRTSEGHRKVLARITAPEDVKDTSFLISEEASGVSMSVFSPGFDEPKVITGGETSGSLFGTDFSYEDFERLQGLNWEAEAQALKRLDDASAEDRPTYVLESRPQNSAYERILSYIDKETCITLRTELYESDREVRKVLIADPDGVRRLDGAWFPHDLLLIDLRDDTQTHLTVASVNTGLELGSLNIREPIPIPKPEVEPPKPEFDELDVGTPKLQ